MSNPLSNQIVPANTLFNPRLHFASMPNVKRLRESDVIWLQDAMARLVRAFEEMFDGEIPELELEEYVSLQITDGRVADTLPVLSLRTLIPLPFNRDQKNERTGR